VQAGTFGLVEWGIEEDPAGLEGLLVPPPDSELAYRGNERHPVPSRDLARTAGRGEGGRARRKDEEERRARRFPPPAEVAYEILAGAGGPLTLVDVAAQGAERLLMPEAFVRDVPSLEAALLEDNRRRESAGRKPLFQIEADTVTLVAQPEPGERAPAPQPSRAVAAMPADVRRAALAALRRRVRECDGPTVEHVAARLLEVLGFHDLKVAKRGREHVIYTARKKLGLADVRHGVRILRGGADATRRDVTDVRRDLGHYGAQIGLVITAGDAAREARSEAAAAGQLPVVLICGEALAEALADASVGCKPVVVPEVDEAFFRAAAELAEKEEAARRARREERDRRDDSRRDESRPRQDRQESPAEAEEEPPRVARETARERDEAPPAPSPRSSEPIEVFIGGAASDDLDDEGDGEEEGPEAEGDDVGEPAEGAATAAGPQEAGAAGERRRRRRRRRRRGGRGRGREGGAAPGAPEGAAAARPAEAASAAPEGPDASSAAPPAPPAAEPAPRDPGEGGGEGSPPSQ
jgi:hypothetical protein